MHAPLTTSAQLLIANARESRFDAKCKLLIDHAIANATGAEADIFRDRAQRPLKGNGRRVCVYAITLEGRDVVKIGMSRFPYERLEQINRSMPDTARLYAFIDGTHLCELAAHVLLAEHRIKLEWYTFNSDVARFVEEFFHVLNPGERINSCYC